MTITAESETRPQLSARAALATWLQSYLPHVSADTPASELTKKARSLGASDPMVMHWIRQVEAEAQQARAQRHSEQCQQVKQHIEQQIAQQRNAAMVDDAYIYKCIHLWVERNLGGHVAHLLAQQFNEVWKDVAGQIVAQERIGMQKHVAENNKTTQKRIDELEALVWTHFQTFERGHAEAVQQATQRMTTLETTLPETRSAIDDVDVN
jgi:hypothetical protein